MLLGLRNRLTFCASKSSGIQFVLEEKVMGESGFHPFEVTGTEGVYGLILTACVIMPILARIPGSDVGGVFENTAAWCFTCDI